MQPIFPVRFWPSKYPIGFFAQWCTTKSVKSGTVRFNRSKEQRWWWRRRRRWGQTSWANPCTEPCLRPKTALSGFNRFLPLEISAAFRTLGNPLPLVPLRVFKLDSRGQPLVPAERRSSWKPLFSSVGLGFHEKPHLLLTVIGKNLGMAQ